MVWFGPYFTYVQTMLRHVVISLSFMPSFFVIHDSCLTLINLNEKFQTGKKLGAKTSKIRDV